MRLFLEDSRVRETFPIATCSAYLTKFFLWFVKLSASHGGRLARPLIFFPVRVTMTNFHGNHDIRKSIIVFNYIMFPWIFLHINIILYSRLYNYNISYFVTLIMLLCILFIKKFIKTVLVLVESAGYL